MPETQSSAPAPQQKDDAAFLDDIALAAETGHAPETQSPSGLAEQRDLLPNVSVPDAEAVLKSLRGTGMLARILALVADPAK